MTEAQELAENFSNFVNRSNSRSQAEFIEAFKRQHRTLQQSMVKSMLGVIEAVAERSYPTDGRNEESHNVCSKLIKGYKGQVAKDFAEERYQNKLKESDILYIKSDNCLPSKRLPLI